MLLRTGMLPSGWSRVGALGHVLLVSALLCCAAGAAADEVLPLYFEWGPPLYDFLDLGGADINPYAECNNAGGGYAVAGFDQLGEWIEILIALPEPGSYEVSASFKSQFGMLNVLELSLRPAAGGAAQSREISYYGAGLG